MLSLPPQLTVALQQAAAGVVFDKYLVGTVSPFVYFVSKILLSALDPVHITVST
jgi:hypothetical protein